MDILEYAIQMELDGEKFYLDLAMENRDNSLHTVFISLARDESKHAEIIRERKEGRHSALGGEVSASVENVFSGSDGIQFAGNNPGQVDAYRKALKKEQESIDLYQKLLSESEKDRELYTFLIAQEKEHYRLLEEIIRMVNRPNQWVESAEFGIREEY